MALPKLTKYRLSKARKNMRRIYESTTQEERNQGKQWYKTAHELAKLIQEETGHSNTMREIAGIISALSPGNKWERNIQDAKAVIMANNTGLSPEQIKVCTYSKNKQKAFQIAQGLDLIQDTARKTFSFVENILLNPDRVTIDRWHLRALFGAGVEGTPTPKIYDQLARLTIQEAEKVGLKGYEYQAIIWEKIRTT